MSAEPRPSYAEVMAARAEAEGDTVRRDYYLRIKARVDEAPPLTQAQKDRLRILLCPDPAQHHRKAA